MRKLLLFFVLFFWFFSFSYWDTQIINDEEYRLYAPESPYINAFTKFEFVEKWKLLVEYDKNYYEILVKAYGWKNILFWENVWEIKTEIKYVWDKVNIIFYKWDIVDKYLQYHLDNFDEYLKIDSNWDNWQSFCSNDTLTKIIWNTIIFDCSISETLTYLINTHFGFQTNNEEKKEILVSLIKKDYKSFWEIWNKVDINQYNNEYFLNDFINFLHYEGHDYMSLYNKYLDKEKNRYVFHIKNNKNDLYDYITDNIFYSLILRNASNSIPLNINKWNLYLNQKDELFYIWETQEFGNNFISLDNFSCHDFNDTGKCENENWVSIDINFNNFQIISWNKILFNISKLIEYVYDQWLINNKNILSNIFNIGINEDGYYFPYIPTKNDILPLASKIASPKDINTNPFMIWFNIILALLYLITFYFTAQFFNSYFEKVATKNNINKKLSDFTTLILKTPFLKINHFLRKLLEKRKYKKLLEIDDKISSFLHKNEHKIWIILWLLFLWIIWQITVDDFDILSVKWLLTIIIMIFILWLITFFKDFVLYFLNKSKEKENIKIENIPIWFLLATIVASSGRSVWLEPNMLFWNVLRIKPKNDKIEKKILSWELVFKVLFITFLVWLSFWFLTLLFSPESFFYKFFIIAYFWIVNDVFFALLPFWLLWWVYIFNEKKLRIKWFLFTFIVFLFLIHTILNPEWDLQKVLDFDGNILILVWFLIFWILTALWTYLYFKKSKKV